MILTRKKADPYEMFKLWCFKNGFSDVINCESEDVNLRRLNQAINQFRPMNHAMPRTAGHNAPLSRGYS